MQKFGVFFFLYKEEFNTSTDLFHLLYSLRNLLSELCKYTSLRLLSESDDDRSLFFPLSEKQFFLTNNKNNPQAVGSPRNV